MAAHVPGGPLADTAQELLGRADTALYRAKQDGRNRVCRAPSTEVSTVG